MATPQKLRFSQAANNSRPFKSHRYDVFGIKVQRNLFLYGELALSGFVALEADPAVIAYCERPIVIEEIKPKRVIDFWVQYSHGEELWFLLRPSENEWLDRDYPPTRAFHSWAESKGLTIRLLPPEIVGVGSLQNRNWGEIVRHLAANLKHLDNRLLERVTDYCREVRSAFSIGNIQDAFPNDDPIHVRTAVFRLLHSGSLVAVDLGETRLGLDTKVNPA